MLVPHCLLQGRDRARLILADRSQGQGRPLTHLPATVPQRRDQRGNGIRRARSEFFQRDGSVHADLFIWIVESANERRHGQFRPGSDLSQTKSRVESQGGVRIPQCFHQRGHGCFRGRAKVAQNPGRSGADSRDLRFAPGNSGIGIGQPRFQESWSMTDDDRVRAEPPGGFSFQGPDQRQNGSRADLSQRFPRCVGIVAQIFHPGAERDALINRFGQTQDPYAGQRRGQQRRGGEVGQALRAASLFAFGLPRFHSTKNRREKFGRCSFVPIQFAYSAYEDKVFLPGLVFFPVVAGRRTASTPIPSC